MLCRHVWLSNAGRGGEPVFVPRRPSSRRPQTPTMRGECRTCGTREWFTPAEWSSLLPREKQ